jgi:hypothetical protein
MAAFNPGAGGTLKSTTLEAIAVEAALALQNQERDKTTTDVTFNNIAVSFFTGDNVVTVQAVLPFTASFVNGQVALRATDYIGVPFTGGGDLQATTLPEAVIELFQRLQNVEKTQAEAGDKVQVSYNTETGIATINAELPVSYSVAADGSVSVNAVSYLA